jgi:hypothetical protein
MEVRKIIRRGRFLLAVLNGFPTNLTRSDGHPKPTDARIIQSGMDKHELISLDNHGGATLDRVQGSNDSLNNFRQDHDPFLHLPGRTGKKFCDPDAMARPDSLYCWVVDSAGPATLHLVKGTAPGRRIAYRIRFVATPDDHAFDYAAGVGLTAYDYHRHRTVADTEFKRVEFHLDGDGSAHSASAHP